MGFSGHVVQVAITSQLRLCGTRESVSQIRSSGEGEMGKAAGTCLEAWGPESPLEPGSPSQGFYCSDKTPLTKVKVGREGFVSVLSQV